MALPGFVIKFGMEQAGASIGGAAGSALGALGATSAFLTEAVGSLAQKLNDGTARSSDVLFATAAAESFLVSVGVYGTAVGSTAVVAPGAFVGGLVIAAAIAATYYRNPNASEEALFAAWDAFKKGEQPWDILKKIGDAWNTERSRQNAIGEPVGTNFQGGINWFRPSDPLILDLDNDGIELSASSSAVLFDHNADGLKTGTQWARADDGILVRDLNGNGSIDSGRELFGDQTQITTINALGQSVTTLATNGFVALRALDADANGVADGIFNATDVAYSGLKLWRDLNQDGISQTNELQTLVESGVTAIQLTQTPTQVTQGKSTFTLTVAGVDANGEPVSTSTTQTAQNVNFTQNTFYREFSDAQAITAEAAALPQMQGTGQVRDLRGAMSVVGSNGQTTAPATALQLSLQAFQTANTAKERQTQVASVIDAWANTSTLGDAKARNPASTQPRGSLHRRQPRATQSVGCKRGLGRLANQRCGVNYLYCYQ